MKTAAWIVDGLAAIPFVLAAGGFLNGSKKDRGASERTADFSGALAFITIALALVWIAYWLRQYGSL